MKFEKVNSSLMASRGCCWGWISQPRAMGFRLVLMVEMVYDRGSYSFLMVDLGATCGCS